jgi:hypothetical protein
VPLRIQHIDVLPLHAGAQVGVLHRHLDGAVAEYFFIEDEGLFENRVGVRIHEEVKKTRPDDPVYVYCFTGKVDYLDAPKETVVSYDDLAAGNALRINMRFLFEKPMVYRDEREYRFVWFCTNRPLAADYQIYSINEDYFDAQIDPTNCFSRTPVEYKPSPKTISPWDLNK